MLERRQKNSIHFCTAKIGFSPGKRTQNRALFDQGKTLKTLISLGFMHFDVYAFAWVKRFVYALCIILVSTMRFARVFEGSLSKNAWRASVVHDFLKRIKFCALGIQREHDVKFRFLRFKI